MERLGNYLRKHLPDLQARVEKELDVSLGKIDVLPLPKYTNEILLTHEKFMDTSPAKKWLSWAVKKSALYLIEDFCNVYATIGDSAIYYSRGPILNWSLTEKEMYFTSLHELAHIAHFRLAGISSGDKGIPKHITEGFADYVAVSIMGDTESTETITKTNCVNYKYFLPFLKEIINRNAWGIRNIKKFVCDYPSKKNKSLVPLF